MNSLRMNSLRKNAGKVLLLGTIGVGLLSFPIGASAKDGDVIRTGNCSGATDWKLKLSPENGRIEAEAEIDSNVNGQNWNVKLKRNGSVFFQGTRMTRGPSGSFEVRRVTNNGAGTDTFVLKATNPQTGEVCRGTATF